MPDALEKLKRKLRKGVGHKVIIVKKSGGRQPGRLNYFGSSATRIGSFFIILDIGTTQIYHIEDIEDVEIRKVDPFE